MQGVTTVVREKQAQRQMPYFIAIGVDAAHLVLYYREPILCSMGVVNVAGGYSMAN